MKVLHLSRARDAADGGVAMALTDLRRHQAAIPGLASEWSTPRDPGSLSGVIQSTRPDLLHVHGLWSAPNRVAARFRARLPLVVAPHGMLDPWAFAHHRRRKQLLWWLYEQRCLQSSAALHALCPQELGSLRDLGLRAPIALIPNGVMLPPQQSVAPTAVLPWADVFEPDTSVLLFLGRFHEKKGLQPLLQAWQSVSHEAALSGWSLALVGYGDAGALQREVCAAQARGDLDRVCVCGPVFAADKQAVLSAASAFVLPSFSEGLPMAALEAMAHRLPCLLSKACNIPEAFAAGAALAAEPDPDALVPALRQLFALSAAERSALGDAGRALVAERFSWDRLAAQTLALYRWILGGGDRPGFVELATP